MYVVIIAAVIIAFGEECAPTESVNPWVTLVGTFASVLLPFLACLGIAHFFIKGRRAHSSSLLFSVLGYNRAVWSCLLLVLGGFFVCIHFLRWGLYVDRMMGMEHVPLVREFLYLLPFIAGLILAWIPMHRMDQAIRPYEWPLREYISFHARQYLAIVLLPWLIFMGTVDGAALVVGQKVASRPIFQWGVAMTLLLTLYVLGPYALRLAWPLEHLQESYLRERLEMLCRKARMKLRDILVWRTGRAWIVNAAVTGLIPQLRYILISDAMLGSFPLHEIEAVCAHEIGHIKRHHMVYYLLFGVGFIFAYISATEVVSRWVPREIVEGSVGMIIALVAYWGGVFGFFSRRFEREADLYACALIGDVMPLVQALEHIAQAHGTRKRFGWRHFSIARRVAFLLEVRANPDVGLRRIRALRFQLALFVAAICIVAVHVLWSGALNIN